MRIKGSEAFLKTLHAAGVEYIFGNPGTTEISLLDQLNESGEIKYILALHESVAAAMADGYARVSGIPGVVSVHTAAGTANSLGMAINAYADYTPLVVMAGLKDSRSLGGGVFCDSPYNAADLMRQYTRWAWQCLESQNISRDTAMALHHALSPPQGPAYLAIPENFWDEDVGDSLHPPSTAGWFEAAAGAEAIENAVQLIVNAKRPIILAGNEAGREGAVHLLVKLAEQLNAPVFCEERINWAYSAFPNNHPLYCGPFNYRSDLIREADLLVGIGSKLFMPPGYAATAYLSPGTKVIHLHSDCSQIGSLYPANGGLPGSVAQNMEMLLAGVREAEIPRWDQKWLKLWHEHGRKRQDRLEQSGGIACTGGSPGHDRPHIFQLIRELSKCASSDAIIINEGIRAGFHLQDYFELPLSRSYFGYTGGCLGWGVPAAMGIKLAKPQRQVIAFVGDGSFLFSCQALWTAAHYGIAIKIVVCNNLGYMAVQSSLQNYKGNLSQKDNLTGSICEPAVDFFFLAQSFGVPAFRVDTCDELREKLEQALQIPGPALLEVRLSNRGLETRQF